MLISSPCVVSLTWTLADGQGEAIDELAEPMEFYFGGDDLLPKLEEALDGQAPGFETHLRLEPERAQSVAMPPD
jgi:FKBP-type peptidyl-prolyl cis-trans isomerase SlyD